MSKSLKDHLTKGIYPYPRQIEGIKFMLKHHYCIMNGKPGVGKTLMATSVALLEGGKTICIVPSSLKLNWKNEIESYCDKRVKVINTGRDLDGTYNDDWDFLICSYSFIHRIEKYAAKARTILFDEAHYLCNPQAKRTESAHDLIWGLKPKRVLLLSGTPIKNRVLEYYSLLSLVSYNPKKTSGVDISISYPSYFDFADTFSFKTTIKINGRRVNKYEGTRNIPELKRLLKNKMVTIKKVVELPDHQEIDVFVDSAKVDERLIEDFEAGNGHISTAKSKSALAKAKATGDFTNDLLANGNGVIVFSDHVESANTIFKRIKGRKGIITGSVPVSQRDLLVTQFQNGDLDCLVLTIGSAGVGYTLTRAKYMVLNDLSWVEADNEQARKRILRVGQDKKTIFYYMLGSKLDKKIKETLRRKVRDLKEIV